MNMCRDAQRFSWMLRASTKLQATNKKLTKRSGQNEGFEQFKPTERLCFQVCWRPTKIRNYITAAKNTHQVFTQGWWSVLWNSLILRKEDSSVHTKLGVLKGTIGCWVNTSSDTPSIDHLVISEILSGPPSYSWALSRVCMHFRWALSRVCIQFVV